MHSREEGLITGGGDCLIIFWNLDLNKENVININLK